MKDINERNIKRWDEIAPIHAQSDYYKIDRFITNKQFSTLTDLERTEIGDIAGKSLLHLQCHIGTDTLSLARLGAKVTGADYSTASILQARRLAERSAIAGNFIISDIYNLAENLTEKFDIVYSNWGALPWLKDISAWTKIVSGFLKSGGMFYMAEIHPFSMIFGRNAKISGSTGQWHYFPQENNTPMQREYSTTYTGDETQVANTTFYQWPYTLGDIISGLADNNMAIEFLHEHPQAVYKQMPDMIQLENGMFVRPENEIQIPLSFSLKAHKSS